MGEGLHYSQQSPHISVFERLPSPLEEQAQLVELLKNLRMSIFLYF